MESTRTKQVAALIAGMTWRELNEFASSMKGATEYRYGNEPQAGILRWADKVLGREADQ